MLLRFSNLRSTRGKVTHFPSILPQQKSYSTGAQDVTNYNHNKHKNKHRTPIITTPIFYVNGPPHVGHLYTTLLADTMKHWFQMQPPPPPKSEATHEKTRKRSWLITGTDEHGSKVQKSVQAALQQQQQQQSEQNSQNIAQHAVVDLEKQIYDYCTSISQQFQQLCSDFHIEYDSYVRTTSSFHRRVVSCLWRQLVKNDAIYMGEYNGWYCMSDECFQTDVSEVIDPVTGGKKVISNLSGHPCEWLTEKNYKFRLSKYRPMVLEWLKSSTTASFNGGSNGGGGGSHLISPMERLNEVMAALTKHVEEKDQDLSVSRVRDRVQWGIPVPGDNSQTIYVWLDALANYITGSLRESDFGGESDEIAFEDLRSKLLTGDGAMWPPRVQILGKDIVKFHAFYWPAFLIALDLPLPEQLIVHPYWTVNRVKMSKSLGNVLNPSQMISDIMRQEMEQQQAVAAGSGKKKSSSKSSATSSGLTVDDARDYVRYYLLREGNLRDDSNFSTAEFPDRVNELANAFGNLWSRMFNKRFVPGARTITYHASHIGEAGELIERINKLQHTLKQCYNAGDIKPSVVHTFSTLHKCNELFDELKPWIWLKEASNAELSEIERANIEKRIESFMFVVAETLRCCAIALYPIMPRRMSKLLHYFGSEHVNIEELRFAARGEQLTLSGHTSEILFPKMSNPLSQ